MYIFSIKSIDYYTPSSEILRCGPTKIGSFALLLLTPCYWDTGFDNNETGVMRGCAEWTNYLPFFFL